jgi:cytochrome P450
MPTAPHVSINLAAFAADPYPMLAHLRLKAPVAFVPELGATLLTRRDDVFHWEKETATFSSDQPHGLMNRLMGQNMMRKDGSAHMAERKIYFQAVSPKAVAQTWTARFQVHADRILDGLNAETKLDLIEAFALPLAAECLKEMTGLTNVSYQTMDGWSQALIAGIANYTGDPTVEADCMTATAEIDAAIDDRLAGGSAAGGHDLLRVMLAAGMPLENVRHNIKLTISGGQNEPRKAIAGCIWALLTHPEQRAAAVAGRIRWLQVFEEYIRWMAPIGMSPRRIAQPVAIHGVQLAPENRVFLMFNAANRDETYFAEPDRFIATRDTTKAIAFGAGPHFCAGAWAARAMVADVALPSVFRRWPNLQLDTSQSVQIRGWAFRGLLNLPVTLN